MVDEAGKGGDARSRLTELVERARRMKDQWKGAVPDAAAIAAMQDMTREIMSLTPTELRGASRQFKQAAAHARRAAELLDGSPPDVREAKQELARARIRASAGNGNAILPAITGDSNLTREDVLEIMRAAVQAARQAKDLEGELGAEPPDLSTVRDRAGALADALEQLASRVHDDLESRTDGG